jgi:hypothetical protein
MVNLVEWSWYDRNFIPINRKESQFIGQIYHLYTFWVALLQLFALLLCWYTILLHLWIIVLFFIFRRLRLLNLLLHIVIYICTIFTRIVVQVIVLNYLALNCLIIPIFNLVLDVLIEFIIFSSLLSFRLF